VAPTAVNTTHPDYDAAAAEWSRARDVLAGEDAVKAGGERYLPRLDCQTDQEFGAYVKRASCFNANARTSEAYLGLMFRRSPFVKLANDGAGVGRAMAEFQNDADMLGTPLAGYAKMGKGINRKLEFELGAWFEGFCGLALVLALSQRMEHGLGPSGRADLHPRCSPLDRQGRFAPQPGSDGQLAGVAAPASGPLGLLPAPARQLLRNDAVGLCSAVSRWSSPEWLSPSLPSISSSICSLNCSLPKCQPRRSGLSASSSMASSRRLSICRSNS
jgi:hypothetical protein